MSTKLKDKIVIELETVEDAVSLANWLDIAPATHQNFEKVHIQHVLDVWKSLTEGLKSNGIDFRKWRPTQPTIIAGHTIAETKPDGSIKIGCTWVTAADIDKAKQLSTEAMEQAEPEWPKWFYKEECNVSYYNLLRMDGAQMGQWLDTRRGDREYFQQKFQSPNYIGEQLADGYKPIPATTAREILGRK